MTFKSKVKQAASNAAKLRAAARLSLADGGQTRNKAGTLAAQLASANARVQELQEQLGTLREKHKQTLSVEADLRNQLGDVDREVRKENKLLRRRDREQEARLDAVKTRGARARELQADRHEVHVQRLKARHESEKDVLLKQVAELSEMVEDFSAQLKEAKQALGTQAGEASMSAAEQHAKQRPRRDKPTKATKKSYGVRSKPLNVYSVPRQVYI